MTEPLTVEDAQVNGYWALREIPGHGLCCLARFIYTIGLQCQNDARGYAYRYCYESLVEAEYAIENWDGEGHPPGMWIKRKGLGGDLPNPLNDWKIYPTTTVLIGVLNDYK